MNKDICTQQEASRLHVEEMLSLPIGEDTRSKWTWIRLSNGDLIFGCFPSGDHYLLIQEEIQI